MVGWTAWAVLCTWLARVVPYFAVLGYPALGVQGVPTRGLQHVSVVCLLRAVADGGGEPWVIAGVRAVVNHVRDTVRCVTLLRDGGRSHFRIPQCGRAHGGARMGHRR